MDPTPQQRWFLPLQTTLERINHRSMRRDIGGRWIINSLLSLAPERCALILPWWGSWRMAILDISVLSTPGTISCTRFAMRHIAGSFNTPRKALRRGYLTVEFSIFLNGRASEARQGMAVREIVSVRRSGRARLSGADALARLYQRILIQTFRLERACKRSDPPSSVPPTTPAVFRRSLGCDTLCDLRGPKGTF